MQINAPQGQVLPPPAAIAPQVVRNHVQPPAAPKISPRAIDGGSQGEKGSASGTSTQKQTALVRSTSGRSSSGHAQRGSQLDVLV